MVNNVEAKSISFKLEKIPFQKQQKHEGKENWSGNKMNSSRDSLNLNAQVYGNSRNPGACCTIVKSNKPQATSLSLFAWYTRCDYFIITHRTIICDVSYKLLTEKNPVKWREKSMKNWKSDKIKAELMEVRENGENVVKRTWINLFHEFAPLMNGEIPRTESRG